MEINELRLHLALSINECQRLMYELFDVRKMSTAQVQKLEEQLAAATTFLPLEKQTDGQGQVLQYVYRYQNVTTEERRDIMMIAPDHNHLVIQHNEAMLTNDDEM